MMVIPRRVRQFYILSFMLLSVCIAKAQQIELSKYYYEQIEENDFSQPQKERLLDSLLQQKNIKKDTLQLLKIYRSFVLGIGFSDLKKSIYYAEQIEKIANASQKFDIEDVQKNHRNWIILLYRNQQFYQAIQVGETYLQRYPEKNKYLGKVYRQLGNIYSDLGDYEQAFQNYDKSIFILKSFNSEKDLILTYISKLETLVAVYDANLSDEILSIEATLNTLLEANDVSNKNLFAKYLNLGVFYDKIYKNFDKALYNYEKSIELSLVEKDSMNNLLASNPIGIQVIPKSTLNVLIINGFPTFETKYLKKY